MRGLGRGDAVLLECVERFCVVRLELEYVPRFRGFGEAESGAVHRAAHVAAVVAENELRSGFWVDVVDREAGGAHVADDLRFLEAPAPE